MSHAQLDPIGRAGDELRDSIDHATQALSALIDKGDKAAKERLEQLQTIVAEATNRALTEGEAAALRTLGKAKEYTDTVRAQAVEDLKQIVRDVDCKVQVSLLDSLPALLGSVGEVLNTNQIRLKTPVPFPEVETKRSCRYLSIGCPGDPNVIPIERPFDRTYLAVRKRFLDSLEEVNDSTPAHGIVTSYAFLSDFALKTACFLEPDRDRWVEEHLEFKEKAKRWRRVLNISIE
ncbi:hypothetical protein E0H66_37250 [Rhizobium leguminosarum bv. viciae]|nr:hypothetical protein E0H66_37250 [Rhizobium leguminosarum bv. viciae]